MKNTDIRELYMSYCDADIAMTCELYEKIKFTIKNVIFNGPATIVFWEDGTKTVVKCDERDEFDPEKSIAMTICKKVFDNKSRYFNQIKKWARTYN